VRCGLKFSEEFEARIQKENLSGGPSSKLFKVGIEKNLL
jgi:hypothetical protein